MESNIHFTTFASFESDKLCPYKTDEKTAALLVKLYFTSVNGQCISGVNSLSDHLDLSGMC